VWEWPTSVSIFVAEARRILSYLKNYGEDQKPPKSIWHSPKKCDKWIKDHDPFKKDGKGGSNTMMDILDSERE
jgi:hypothetical protein